MVFEFLFSGSILATCIVGLVAGLFVYWLMRRWKYKYPPGPPGLPFIGNALQISRTKLHEQALEWSKKYGPVITVRIGATPFVIVNKIEPALEALVTKSINFAGRMITPSVDVITFGGKYIAFSSYGPIWKMHRRIASKALRHYMQGDALESRIHDAVKTAFDEIDKVQGEFDPSSYVSFIIGNILTGLCFGGKYAFKNSEVSQVLHKRDVFIEQFGIGAWEDFVPGLRHVYKTDVFKRLEVFTQDMMEDFMRRKLKLAETTFNKDNVRHFADTLLLARLEATEEEGAEVMEALNEDRLVQTLADIFFAGIDASRFSLNDAILHMVAFPDIQEKVQQEIDRVVGRERLPGISDRSDLCYTEAVLHESMRLTSALPLGLQHMTLCDTDLSEYRIPKGTLVAINHWGIHHDPDAWEDVGRFMPERYLDENGKLGPKPMNWLPFSAGTRVCLGEFVAKPNLHLTFASLIQRYKWKMVSGKSAHLTQVGAAFGLCYKPFKVIVEKRF